MTVLPPFTPDGLLPPGDYLLTLDELHASPLVRGSRESVAAESHWDAAWRGRLVDNLSVLVGQLWHVGITEILRAVGRTAVIQRGNCRCGINTGWNFTRTSAN